MSEGAIRLSIFLGLFAVLALAEALLPRRERNTVRSRRWLTNWGITVANTLTIRFMAFALPVLAVGAAADAQANGIGLLNMVGLPIWVELIITILVLDFLIWGQHLVTHKMPILWRLHRVHHSDRDMDVTTAIRFHPIEIAISMLIKIGAVYLLGPAAWAVIVFEILLNGSAMFNHSNLALPPKVDRIMRRVVITPDMHRVHHSVHRDEHDSNYGFFLSIWDQMFKTYIPQPRDGHDDMMIGLAWQDERPNKLTWSLGLPFFKQ